MAKKGSTEKIALMCTECNRKNYTTIKNDIKVDILNIYLLPEINKQNEKDKGKAGEKREEKSYDDTEKNEQMIINKNYSTIINFFKYENGKYSDLKDTNMSFKVDIVFPFELDIGQGEEEEKKEQDKGISETIRGAFDQLKQKS